MTPSSILIVNIILTISLITLPVSYIFIRKFLGFETKKVYTLPIIRKAALRWCDQYSNPPGAVDHFATWSLVLLITIIGSMLLSPILIMYLIIHFIIHYLFVLHRKTYRKILCKLFLSKEERISVALGVKDKRKS